LPKATNAETGLLAPLDRCFIVIPSRGGDVSVQLKSLPDITDTKSANYNFEPIMGRSSPFVTYSHSEQRTISMTLHFFVTNSEDITTNLRYLRAIQSAVYPRSSDIYPVIPPPICRIKCSELLAQKPVENGINTSMMSASQSAYSEPLCVILRSYSVKFPTEVSWDENTYLPWKFDIDTTWDVVFKNSELPGQERIL
jgi:hypothetical protein